MRFGRILAVASPAFLIAGLGLLHPIFLTRATANQWQLTHLALLPLFPLVGGSFLWLLREERGAVAWAARGLGYGYAVLYSALDAIAGIGAPQQVRRVSAPPIGPLYEVGDRLGHLGVVCLAVCALLTGILLWQRTRDPRALLGGLATAAACVVFYHHHVFPPRGVLAMTGIGIGIAFLAAARRRVPRSGDRL